jgi:hypothetical protein
VSLSFRKFHSLKRRLLASATGRANVHFLHLRKTGGTAIKNALKAHLVTPNSVIHLHPHRVGLRDIPAGHQLIFGVRDPLDRFVSGFGSRLRKGAPANVIPWSVEEELAFSRFADPDSLACALERGHPKHAEAVHAMRHIQHVNSSYWDWFGSPELLASREDSILFIGMTDSLDADFAQLAERLQLPLGATLPKDARSAHRAPDSAKRPTLSEAGIAQLKEWFAKDFQFFDFCEAWRARQGGAVAKR